jgi:hypothetical protein
MNAFQILDNQGNPLTMEQIDMEVCELTGNEVDPKHYCKLGNIKDFKSRREFAFNTYNWYDTIGWMIAADNKSFQDILDYYADSMKEFIGQKTEDGIEITLEYIYPYHTKVLNSWISKGYQAKQVIQ